MTDTIADRASATTSERLVAFLIDFSLLSAVAFALWIVAFVLNAVVSIGAMSAMTADSPGAMGGASFLAASLIGILINGVLWLAVGAILVWYFGYYAADGETFGKRSQDVAVVDEGGDPPSKRDRLVRTAVLLAPFPVMLLLGTFLGWIGFAFAFFLMLGWLALEALVLFVGDGAQRIGDRVAGTYVVDADGGQAA